jgi:hypothetical protein
MALFYDSGKGAVKLTKSFAKKNLGLDVYICCTGPSLKYVKEEDLRIPGVFTIGINTSYPHIKPNLWIGMDKPECYDPDLWWEPFNKICRGNYFEEEIGGFKIKNLANTFFADLAPNNDPEFIFKSRQHDIKFLWKKNTLTVALHMAVWMGAKRIFLLGCDLGGPSDYYDNRVLTPEQKKHNRILYKEQKKYLRSFYKIASKYNIELISCTKDSPINDTLPYYELDYALYSSSKKVPKLEKKILHATELEKNKPISKSKLKQSAESEIDPGTQLKVFVGAEQVELVPTKVLDYSINSRSSIPVQVKPLYEAMQEKGIKIPMPLKIENQPRTNFSFHRWCIPELCGYKGKALYCDSDQIVFDDIVKLFALFDKYPDKTVIVLSDRSAYVETSVMLIDCEKAKWDIKDIVRRLDSNELNYHKLMFEMGLLKKDEFVIGADPNWNSLDQYTEGETKLLHYTHRSNQPWKRGLSEYTHLWMEELKKAVDSGFLPKETVQRHIDKKFIGEICLQAINQ